MRFKELYRAQFTRSPLESGLTQETLDSIPTYKAVVAIIFLLRLRLQKDREFVGSHYFQFSKSQQPILPQV